MFTYNNLISLMLAAGFTLSSSTVMATEFIGSYSNQASNNHFLAASGNNEPKTSAQPVEKPSPVRAQKQVDYAVQKAASAPVVSTAGISDSDYRKSALQALSLNGDMKSSSSQAVKNYLAKMVRDAKNYSPNLREATAIFQAAEEDVSQAKGQRLPQVSVGLQSSPAQFGSGSRIPKDQQQNGLTVNMTTPVFDWGYNSNTIDSKSFSAKAAQNNVNAQFEDTAYQVCQQLSELAKQKLIYQFSQSFVERMQKLVTMIQKISEIDSGRVSELTQARARLLQAEASRDSAGGRIRDAEIALNRLTGNTSFQGLPISGSWGLSTPREQALLKDVDKHPSILQARNEAIAAYNQAQAVKSSNLPQLNWVVEKGLPISNSAYEEQWQTYLNVSWKLFQGGSGNAAERAAAMRAQAAKHKVAEQEILLKNKIMSALHDSTTFLSQAGQYHRLVVETDQIRKDFFEQWRQLNTRTLLDVLTAESDFYNNQVSEIDSRFSAYEQIFNGYASSGYLTRWLGVE